MTKENHSGTTLPNIGPFSQQISLQICRYKFSLCKSTGITGGGQGTHDGNHGQMPKDFESDTSCRVPSQVCFKNFRCGGHISVFFTGMYLVSLMTSIEKDITEQIPQWILACFSFWHQQISHGKIVALEVAHKDLHKLYENDDLRASNFFCQDFKLGKWGKNSPLNDTANIHPMDLIW